MADARYCPSCGLPLGPLERHGRQRDCICALQARVKALEETGETLDRTDRSRRRGDVDAEVVKERDEARAALAAERSTLQKTRRTHG